MSTDEPHARFTHGRDDPLQQLERIYRRGFEQATVPTLLLDADGRCTYANAAALALLGVDEAALAGRPLLTLLEAAPEALAVLAQHLAGDASGPLPIHARVRQANGSEAFVRASVAALDPDDVAGGFLAELVDETELQLATRALRESEERLAYALDATTDGLWDWDLPSGRLTLNARWCTMLGYTLEELAPHIETWQQLTHPDDVPVAFAQLDAHAAGTLPQIEFEMRMRKKDGSWLWILDRAKIVARDAAGAPTRVVGTHTDIHARKLQDQALRAQTALLDTVLSNIPIAIDIVGTDGATTYMNAHLEQLLGWTMAELATADASARVQLDVDARARAAASRESAAAAWQDRRLVTRDGRTLTLEWADVRLPDGRTIGIGTDVTAQRAAEAEEARRLAQQEQAQKLESLGLLAGGIAHDFNNLLVGILGNASLAEELLPPASPAQEVIADVRVAARRAADLTRQLLAYAGKGRFVIEPVDVSTVVGELASLLRAAVSRRAVLRQELSTGLPGVRADATQLRQVVMNLITNASDALGEADGVIVLRTFLHEPDAAEREAVVGGSPLAPGRYVCIEVDDSGSGMSAATVQRIFDPFFTTKVSGHGLGLAATLGIVRSHGGAVRVRTAEGRGTSVRVYLPASGEPIRPASSAPADDVATALGSGRLLLADDEPGVLAVARRTLERSGFTVVTCADGAEAVERFTADPDGWRAVVLDLTMPVMGGQEALLAIRALRPDVPAVLMSGYASEGLRPEVTALPRVAYVQKPFTPAGLAEAVLGVSEARRESHDG